MSRRGPGILVALQGPRRLKSDRSYIRSSFNLSAKGASPATDPSLTGARLKTLAADEGQKVRVDHVGVDREHAMRVARVDLQRPALEKLDREQSRVLVRNDLVVVPVHHERRRLDGLQVLREIRLRERLDPLVMGLG